MWDMIWYLGFPMFAISVLGMPMRHNVLDEDRDLNLRDFDVVYDQRQNGTENYNINVDGVSLVWAQNSLLEAAALLEPALFGEYFEPSVEVVFEPKPEEQSVQNNGNKTVTVPDIKSNETRHSDGPNTSFSTIEDTNPKNGTNENAVNQSKSRLIWPKSPLPDVFPLSGIDCICIVFFIEFLSTISLMHFFSTICGTE
ncbi:hypothetical protein ABEB36_012471 [Hypothenemus hampei]|uniref:Uncharacterized protein n=1 Tax=Hypothenemus hampei TaxID=57062 RepID=A0ABD1EDC7_HYPHA